jgi:HAD superfamily hydrolase (TIGR01484 family)
MLAISSEVQADEFLIAGDGAFIYDLQNQEVVYSNFIEKQKILEIINVCEENSIFYSIYTPDMILTKSIDYNVLFYNSENKKNPPDKRININITEDMHDYIQKYEKKDFLKMTVCDSDKIIFSAIINKLKKIKDIEVLDIAHMSRKLIKSGTIEKEIGYFYTEISNKNVNKWTALQNLIEKLNIKREETIGIGDNINDIELVRETGLGIAMGNSCPELKKVAKYITKDNDCNGVAEAINKYINNG